MPNITDNVDNLIHEFGIVSLLGFAGKTIGKTTRAARTTSLIVGTIIAGTVYFIVKKLINVIYDNIRQSLFENRIKSRIQSHLLLLESFVDYCSSIGIRRSGLVKFENISSETHVCIKNPNHDEAILCAINIIKKMHFYVMDLFLQSIYFSNSGVAINFLFDINDIDFKDESINNIKIQYYTLLIDFFDMIKNVKTIQKTLVIDIFELESEFNNKFLELNSFYQKVKK